MTKPVTGSVNSHAPFAPQTILSSPLSGRGVGAAGGDNIIILNAEKVKVTGAKMTDKVYYWHTGAIGGIKSRSLEKMMAEHPERVIEIAVKGMLPKNPLGRKMFKKLHVFKGDKHPHTAQQPKPLEV